MPLHVSLHFLCTEIRPKEAEPESRAHASDMGTVTATTILRLKVPASSEDKSVEGWTHHGAVERVFTLLANTVKSQPGFMRQRYVFLPRCLSHNPATELMLTAGRTSRG